MAVHGFPHIRDLQHSLQSELVQLSKLRTHVHTTLIAVGNKALEDRRGNHTMEQEGDQCTEDVARTLPTPIKWPFTLQSTADQPQYRIPNWPGFYRWIDSLFDESAPTSIVSWFQIYADFLQFAGQPGPWYNRSKKKWEALPDREPTKFQTKSRWLSNFVTRFSKKLGFSMQLLHCRPTSHVIGFWTSCVLIKMPVTRLQAADRWFQRWQSNFRRAPELHNIGADS